MWLWIQEQESISPGQNEVLRGHKMELKKGMDRIKDLLDAIKDTDIQEIYLEKDGLNIGLKKNITQEITAKRTEKKEEADITPAHDERRIVEVTSHSVGIFRDYILPSRKVMAKVGQDLNKGQKIGFIESMKIMREIVSPVKGSVKSKYVKQGDPVEYGQKLFDIEIV